MDTDLIQTNYAIDTFYFLVMGALVMFMAPGFAMLEAGLVRTKNTTEILTKNIALFSIACIMYLTVGYGLMYGNVTQGSLLPNFLLAGFGLGGAEHTVDAVLSGGDDTPYYSARSDYFFQVVFVATAMSIVSGAVAERMKLWAFLSFAVVLTGFIYPIQGMWSWGGGFLSAAGYKDYAGSGIVHMCGAAAALAAVLVLGPRKGKYGPNGEINPIPGANMPLAALGMFILWFGWFGFNGGSELKLASIDSANHIAQVFVNTNIAACGGLVASLLLSQLIFGKADLTMALNGALAGLVSITADPLSPSEFVSLFIGMGAGLIVVGSIVLLDKLRLDDPVGAISVHGCCGVYGVLAVLISNPEATLSGQLTGLSLIFAWTFVSSLLVWLLLKATMGIRISAQDEFSGADIAECGIEAYPEFKNAG